MCNAKLISLLKSFWSKMNLNQDVVRSLNMQLLIVVKYVV